MKKIVACILYITIITTALPMIIITISDKLNTDEKKEYVNVYNHLTEKTEKMNMSQYLKEVVSAEMPADFEFEALKAQAVAARTYLKYKMLSDEYPLEHKNAPVCTNPAHCKAWISEPERKKLWNSDKQNDNWKKISKAVEETSGEIILYDNKPINAVFHSTSSGMTENAEDVWGSKQDYLVSVKSEEDKKSPKYLSEYCFSTEEFKNKAEKFAECAFQCDDLYSDIIRSNAGGIIKITIGGIELKGTDFRKIYNLNSTNAEIETDNNTVKIITKGYGHGVGMSQYGANYSAQNGMNYKDILKKYYTGISFNN